MTLTLSAAWLALSVMYMGTAVFLHLTHRDTVPASVPFTFLSLGAAIFVVLNRNMFARNDAELLAAELVAIGLLLATWLAAILAVRAYVELVRHPKFNHPLK